MVDQNVILRKMVSLEEYLQDLEEVRESYEWPDFASNKVIRRYVERTLQMAIEACLDIANHLISYEGFREPLNNKDTFQVLLEQGIIPEELVEFLKKMAQFRNVIVHDYLKIDPEIVFGVLRKNLADITDFAIVIKRKYL